MKPLQFLALLALLAAGACQKTEVSPAGCQLVVKSDTDTHTYQFDDSSRVTRVLYQSSRNDVEYRYTYQGRQATLDVTYPGQDWLRLRYDLTLNEQGYLLTAQETMFNRLADGTVEERLTGNHTAAYDAEGHLTILRLEQYSYPFNAPRKTSTYETKIQYQDGNPVVLSYGGSYVYSYQYGTRSNPLKIPLLLETLVYSSSYNIDSALQPLLGKPSRNLLTRLEINDESRPNYPINGLQYTYELNGNGFPVRVSHPNTIVAAPVHSLETTCP